MLVHALDKRLLSDILLLQPVYHACLLLVELNELVIVVLQLSDIVDKARIQERLRRTIEEVGVIEIFGEEGEHLGTGLPLDPARPAMIDALVTKTNNPLIRFHEQ